MKTRWMVWAVVLVMGFAVVPMAAGAQERPESPPAGVERDGPPAEPGDLDSPGDLDDLDGLGLMLMPVAAPAGHGPGRGGMRRAELHKQLNLTDDQKTKIADLRDKRERASIPIQGDLKVAHLDLRKLMRADKPDQRAIDAQIDRIAGLRGSLQKAHVAGMLEVRAVLTPAQQKILRESGHDLMGRGMRMRGGAGMHGGRGMRM